VSLLILFPAAPSAPPAPPARPVIAAEPGHGSQPPYVEPGRVSVGRATALKGPTRKPAKRAALSEFAISGAPLSGGLSLVSVPAGPSGDAHFSVPGSCCCEETTCDGCGCELPHLCIQLIDVTDNFSGVYDDFAAELTDNLGLDFAECPGTHSEGCFHYGENQQVKYDNAPSTACPVPPNGYSAFEIVNVVLQCTSLVPDSPPFYWSANVHFRTAGGTTSVGTTGQNETGVTFTCEPFFFDTGPRTTTFNPEGVIFNYRIIITEWPCP
jgi:hypothetical protein